MTRLLAGIALASFAGWTLVLGELSWFRRRRLIDRIGPYIAAGPASRSQARAGTWETWREVVEPLCRSVGDRMARTFGVTESVGRRLERVHSPMTSADFRFRQGAWMGVGLASGTLLAIGMRLTPALALLFVVGAPLLAFLVVEQQLAQASERWKRRVFLELPVVAEQLAMLLGAGHSLGAALNRLAERGRGACGQDLVRVCERTRLGVSEAGALQEWAGVTDVPVLHRLVGVLALDRQATDLSRLVAEEARAMRREVHRDLITVLERRAQLVWVPVTLATLVPGVIFLAIPFYEALRAFANS